MEGFTKEVLMMWKVLVVERGRCIAPKAGKKGMKMPICGVMFKINSLNRMQMLNQYVCNELT